MKKNKVSFLWIIIILLILVIIGLLLTRDDDLSLAKKLCTNMLNANLLSDGECILSTSVPVLFENYFPNDTPVEDVMSGMQGFRVNQDITRSISNCSDFRIITFQIKKSWTVLLNEYMEISFCDGKLVRQIHID